MAKQERLAQQLQNEEFVQQQQQQQQQQETLLLEQLQPLVHNTPSQIPSPPPQQANNNSRTRTGHHFPSSQDHVANLMAIALSSTLLNYSVTIRDIEKSDSPNLDPNNNNNLHQVYKDSLLQQYLDAERRLKIQQEEDYVTSEIMDKSKQDQENLEKVMILKEQEKNEIAEATKISLEEAEVNQRIQKLRSIVLPDEPEEGIMIQIWIYLPNGMRISRKFRDVDRLSMVKDFVSIQALPENGSNRIPIDFYLISDFPRQVWSDLNTSLGSLGTQFLFRIEEIKEKY
jgi:hypothetical protein